MKKVFSVMLLAVALIFISGQNNQAEASEVYVGTYSDGTAVYLLTETIRGHSWRDLFYCRVRAGYDYLDYEFRHNAGNPTYRNSEGYSGYCYDGSSPVAATIYNYILNHR